MQFNIFEINYSTYVRVKYKCIILIGHQDDGLKRIYICRQKVQEHWQNLIVRDLK